MPLSKSLTPVNESADWPRYRLCPKKKYMFRGWLSMLWFRVNTHTHTEEVGWKWTTNDTDLYTLFLSVWVCVHTELLLGTWWTSLKVSTHYYSISTFLCPRSRVMMNPFVHWVTVYLFWYAVLITINQAAKDGIIHQYTVIDIKTNEW